MENKGKRFEEHFKEDWLKTFPKTFFYRIIDQQTGYVGSTNLCDFLCFVQGKLYLIETKSHLGNTFPWDSFPQYERMISRAGMEGIRSGVVLWMRDHDLIVYLPVTFIKYLKDNGYKSFNVKMLKDEVLNKMFYVIPSTKMTTYMRSDYSLMLNLKEGE